MELEDARRLAARLMHEHGLRDWTFAFDNAKTRAGVCRPGRRQIGLSRPLTALHDEAGVRDTILHEIAHALVGPRHGHDAAWRAKATQLGCSATRCVPEGAARVDGAWVGTCPAGHRFTKHRQPRRVSSCTQCSASFNAYHVITWTLRGEPVPMHPAYEAELAQLLAHPTGPIARPPRLPAGSRVRLRGAGPYAGRTGTIQAARRTRYVVRLDDGDRVTAPFELVDI
jgi:hypothetical protein